MKTTKAQKLASYKTLYPDYDITGVLQGNPYTNGNTSIYDIYANPSDAKIRAFNQVIKQYQPDEILSVAGNCQTFTVTLKTSKGVMMHITRANNYIVEL